MSRAQFDAGCSPDGHLLVGTPEQVAAKIVAQHELFGHDRFLGHISVGVLPHAKAMHATELFATEVAPRVRAALGGEEIETPGEDIAGRANDAAVAGPRGESGATLSPKDV